MTNILTLEIDPASQAHFDELRRRYFPPERNLIPAHLTLFHTLPDQEEISRNLEHAAKAQQAFTLTVTGVRSLGKGVAYTLQSPPLIRLQARLAEQFADHLTAQDKQRLQPHIVVQNKVTPVAARDLLAHLQQSFVSREVQATGLTLWNYLGGPWALARTFRFCTPPTADP